MVADTELMAFHDKQLKIFGSVYNKAHRDWLQENANELAPGAGKSRSGFGFEPHMAMYTTPSSPSSSSLGPPSWLCFLLRSNFIHRQMDFLQTHVPQLRNFRRERSYPKADAGRPAGILSPPKGSIAVAKKGIS